MKLRITICQALAALIPATGANASELILKYNRPAQFFEEALVIGNGNIGGTIYNTPASDRISLNDITLWTGEPEQNGTRPDPRPTIEAIRTLLDKEDYAAADSLQRLLQGHYSQNYQPLGNLHVTYNNAQQEAAGNFTRSLSLTRALAQATNGTRHTQFFASAPDSVIVMRISDPKGIDATISLDSQLPCELNALGNEITMSGYSAYNSLPGYAPAEERFQYHPERGTHFTTIVKALLPDGTVSCSDGKLHLQGGTEAILILTDATSFNGFDHDPVKSGRDHRALARARIDNAAAMPFDTLRHRAEADYSHLFNRVSLDLGTTDAAISRLPTDEQLLRYTDLNESNPDLEELYFQYGRYLLISCSRTKGVPANLQGLWNEHLLPPWNSNYTTNINLEENYWGAETTALPELHEPLLTFIENLSCNGREAASNYWGVDSGWCLAHNSDIWAMACPVGMGNDNPQWANWNMGGAWLATHIWEHYLFGRDKETLRRYYPALRGAATFAMEWLIECDGELITSPSTSPENNFLAPDGKGWPTMKGTTSDLAIIRECLLATRSAAKTLDTDHELATRIDIVLDRLRPYRVGSNGNLQEWYFDYPDEDPHHRHQSHLIGLYPGHHLSVTHTPELAAAAARTLAIKGMETTGWSAGWRVNLLARLHDGENAYRMLRRLLRFVSPDNYNGDDARRGGGTYPNLLDAHAPFQIDGNFGGSAGVAEMLVQSTPDSITLLPALSPAWQNGRVEGLRTRTGLTVALAWRNGEPQELTLTAPSSLTDKASATVVHTSFETPLNVTLSPGETRHIVF